MENTLNYLYDSELVANKHRRGAFLQNRFDYANNLYSKNLKAHFSCVNAIEFSNRESSHLISGGDDKRILLWNINKDVLGAESSPIAMKAQHNSNVFALAWDNENQKIFSGANDHQVIVHDVESRQVCDVFLHENSVLCISVNPKQSQIFATACESGEISLYDLRLSNTDPIILARSRSSSSSSNSYDAIRCAGGAYNSCCFNPVEANLLAIGNEISGLSIIDIRMKSTILRYKADSVNLDGSNESDYKKSSADYKQMIMSCRFNQAGTQLVALRGKSRPVLYLLNDPKPFYYFDHEDFSNACTLKSCCLAGEDDQYFVSGSDDFNVYVWKIPKTSYIQSSEKTFRSTLISDTHFRLKGHRSIVNQCRYNYNYRLLGTSGVEKIIKIWSAYEMPGNCTGGLLGKDQEFQPSRKLYTYKDLFTLRNNTQNNQTSRASSLNMDPNDIALMNYEPVITNRINTEIEESIEEDKIMIAFFDSQVRRLGKHKDAKADEKTSPAKLNRRKLTSQSDSDSVSVNESSDSLFTAEEAEEQSDETESNEDETSESEESSSDCAESEGSSHKKKSKEKPRVVYSSSSSSSTSSEDSEASNDINIDALLRSKNEKCKVKNKSKQLKRSSSLRDRIRNLLHRKSLNIESQSDFKQVLDSLQVESSGQNEQVDASGEKSEYINPSIQIEIAKSSKMEDSSADDESSVKEKVFYSSNSKLPKTSSILVKNLNEHKRKIELEELEASKIKKNDLEESKLERIDVSFKRKKSLSEESKRNYRQNKSSDSSQLNSSSLNESKALDKDLT